MIPRIRWVDREFEFDFEVGLYRELLERLRGTPARVSDRLRGISRDLLTRRPPGHWSIQENAGHLLDLESLFVGRLDDFLASKTALRPADMENHKTCDADHNETDLSVLLSEFGLQRTAFLERLDSLDGSDFARSAMHPRLNKPMRLCDMLYFHAEHDDYHLATITELLPKS
jgi:uncharacterized damage-inducible protein DinB